MQSVCDYLAIPGGYISIYDNATGCNNQQEVEEACGIVSVDEPTTHSISVYPNPSFTQITVELSELPLKNTVLAIYNINGQELITQQLTDSKTEINFYHLPTGIYIVKVWNDKNVMVQKVIKQ